MTVFRKGIAVILASASIVLVAGPTAVALDVPPLPSLADLLGEPADDPTPTDEPNGPGQGAVGESVHQDADPNAEGEVCCALSRDAKKIKGVDLPHRLPASGA